MRFYRTKKDKRQQCRVSRTIDFHPTPHPGASSAGSSDASLSPCGSAVSLSPLSSVSNRLSSSSSDTAGVCYYLCVYTFSGD